MAAATNNRLSILPEELQYQVFKRVKYADVTGVCKQWQAVIRSMAHREQKQITHIFSLIYPDDLLQVKEKYQRMEMACGKVLELQEHPEDFIRPSARNVEKMKEILEDHADLRLKVHVLEGLKRSCWHDTQPDEMTMSRLLTFDVSKVDLGSVESLNLIVQGLFVLPPSVTSCSKLNDLCISNNHLEFVGEELGMITELKSLSMRHNHLHRFPVELYKLTKLERLQLDGNYLRSFPVGDIGQLSSLKSLSLNNNLFSELPEGVSALVQLDTLSLSNNCFETFPPSICNLTKLRFIDFKDNQLTSIPPDITKLKELQTLILTNNQLDMLPRGILPSKYGSTKALSLSGNPLPFNSEEFKFFYDSFQYKKDLDKPFDRFLALTEEQQQQVRERVLLKNSNKNIFSDIKLLQQVLDDVESATDTGECCVS
ncbi:MAG: leucine-rich repeat domain-containing protein [Simkaniaceae bacterium]|nr:leucine-rich repeat domain-containing protein [Simkaniaceae bacterium]